MEKHLKRQTTFLKMNGYGFDFVKKKKKKNAKLTHFSGEKRRFRVGRSRA